MTKKKYCIYCSQEKLLDTFSLEHIWPDALGGDHLDDFWQTDSVCRTCNSTAGVFVDARFIKSYLVAAERWNSEYIYIDPNAPSSTSVPLAFIGHPLGGPNIEGEVPELYMGP